MAGNDDAREGNFTPNFFGSSGRGPHDTRDPRSQSAAYPRQAPLRNKIVLKWPAELFGQLSRRLLDLVDDNLSRSGRRKTIGGERSSAEVFTIGRYHGNHGRDGKH